MLWNIFCSWGGRRQAMKACHSINFIFLIMDENILAVLNRLKQQIEEQAINKKEVLNFNEAALYMGVSKSFLYKKTSTNSITHYCPEGKLIFFKRSDLDAWLLRNRRAKTEEIEAMALAAAINGHNSRRRSK